MIRNFDNSLIKYRISFTALLFPTNIRNIKNLVLNLSSPPSDTPLPLNEQFIFKTIEKKKKTVESPSTEVKRWFLFHRRYPPSSSNPPQIHPRWSANDKSRSISRNARFTRFVNYARSTCKANCFVRNERCVPRELEGRSL